MTIALVLCVICCCKMHCYLRVPIPMHSYDFPLRNFMSKACGHVFYTVPAISYCDDTHVTYVPERNRRVTNFRECLGQSRG